ncbi:MAG TPA: hypothetical protein VK206_13060 [Anaerolineales bacterium]|nr:hypothetical protein [Anaerolineales bacterium]
MAASKMTSEFELLASAATLIRPEFEKDKSPWAGSKFEWVLRLPSASKGKLGKRLVNAWCALKGLSIESSSDSQADIMINGHRVEIKFSTLWEANIYKFQQIRDQNYEYAICLGISPFEAHCWVVSKQVLRTHVIGHMGQHTGSKGQETAWFTVNPKSPPDWLVLCGGTLEEAYKVLKSLSNKK